MTPDAPAPGAAPGPPPFRPTPSPAAAPPRAGAASWIPDGATRLDLAGLAVLIVLGLLGFQHAYGGSRYLIAGAVGVLLGSVVAYASARLRQPAIVTLAATIVVFFVFGGPVAVPEDAIGGVLPSPASVVALVDGAVAGWAKMLTTLWPVGSSGNLLTIPYLCGMLAALMSVTIARRTKRSYLALIPPVAVLALGILFGTEKPVSLDLQGSVFAVVAVGWLSAHRRAERRSSVNGRSSSRWVAAVAMLALAGVGAHVLGDRVPGLGPERVILRHRSNPPLDPMHFPSPLIGYRNYTNPDPKVGLKNRTILTATGLERGDLVRIATLDDYDGLVYGVGQGSGTSGYFQRTGDQIPTEATGDRRHVTVKVGAYDDAWLPDLGSATSIRFSGTRASELRDSFRYNTETGTGAVEALLQPGDRYEFDAVVPRLPSRARIAAAKAATDHLPRPHVTLDNISTWAVAHGKPSLRAWARVQAMAEELRKNGSLSHGIGKQVSSRPGHSASRLDENMVGPNGALVGDDEQFAPLLALAAREVGVPARVVMGLIAPDATRPGRPVALRGRDVHAWVEIDLQGIGWVPITDVSPTKSDPPPVQPKPKPRPQRITPPPPPPPIPITDEDATDANKLKSAGRGRVSAGGGILGTVLTVGGIAVSPFLLIGGITAAIAGLKRRRRTRRRTVGSPTGRIAGGWDELLDLAADLGRPVPALVTRAEAATLLGTSEVQHLATHADSRIFGPGEPSDPQVESFWGEVAGAHRSMIEHLSRFGRWKVLVNLTSLHEGRRRERARRGRRRFPGRRRHPAGALTP